MPNQRFYRAPDFTDGKTPSTGVEVFIGNLPMDMYEENLIPVLEAFGTLKEVKIEMDPDSRLGRGFCFVVYTKGDKANKRVKGGNPTV